MQTLENFDVVCINSDQTFCCNDISNYDHYPTTHLAEVTSRSITYNNKYLHIVGYEGSILTLYNMLGQIILIRSINSKYETIYTGNEETDIYIVNLHSKTLNENHKILIQN